MNVGRNDVVLLTPPGRGAIASVLVAGPDAVGIVARWFHPTGRKPLAEQPLGRILVGRWRDSDGEEVVACRRSSERIEIHCHGGTAAVTAILNDLAGSDCPQTDWRGWLRRSEADPLRAAASVALAEATTERSAAILLDQYAGALRRAVDNLLREIDLGNAEQAADAIRTLLRFAPVGLHLVEPWRVVLAGRPNVGKSSLVNALLGYRRSIVFATPGTTRDVVTAAAALDGWPVELADTAGLHDGGEAIEAAGIERARGRLVTADCVVLVFDAAQSWTPADEQLANAWPSALRVHNKCDLPCELAARPEGLQTSATTGDGVPRLAAAIARHLVPDPPPPGTAVPFEPAQVAVLSAALGAVISREASRAAACLVSLLTP